MATRQEFAAVMAYVTLACGKPLKDDSLEVYFDCLGDLSLDVLKITAKRVVMEHVWATFPSIAELRAAASETMRGEVKDLSGAEAWKLAHRAACRIDLEVDGSLARRTADLPAIVLEAMEAYGVPSLIHADNTEVARAQFLRIFEQLQSRERRNALLPASLKAAIAAQGQRPTLPLEVVKAIGQIGVER